jgi:hypothetical protein
MTTGLLLKLRILKNACAKRASLKSQGREDARLAMNRVKLVMPFHLEIV